MINRRFVLASRPEGAPSEGNFRLETVDVPALGANEVLVRTHFLSLDPYMRGRMSDRKSYAKPQALDEVMIGGTVGEVIGSTTASFAVGDKVLGGWGWQEYAVIGDHGAGLRKVDDSQIPLSAYLGAVGMPGVTAWVGLHTICEPKPGETLVVSAASGAVGGMVGQLARRAGCRVVGVAGGQDKCDYVVRELGFDACIDYKAAPARAAFEAQLAAAAPGGIDCYFENVGGMILDAVMNQMNAFGRIAVCGMISGYNSAAAPLAQPGLILTQRLRVQGFIVSEHAALWPKAIGELAAGVVSGAFKYKETIAHGIESAPAAFIGLLQGKNFGKQLVEMV
jgi:NADPH-dependent curcumin reductase CurA